MSSVSHIESIRYSLENRKTIEPEILTRDDLSAAGCLDRVAVLPKDFNERMSYLANVLVQSICNSSVKDDSLRTVVGQLSQSLCYMMNSCSWSDGTLHDFDYEELSRKLKHFVKEDC